MYLPIHKARPIAEKIVEALRPYCQQIEIAGSIRRGRNLVGDIDIVIEPKPNSSDLIAGRVRQNATWLKGGDQYNVYTLANGFQLDLWCAHSAIPEKRDMFEVVEAPAKPCNFGMLLLSRTGSFQHNIFLCQQAKSLDLHFHPHVGVTENGRVIASETEADIFQALKLDFIAPERREQ